jgi:hypothetical protein
VTKRTTTKSLVRFEAAYTELVAVAKLLERLHVEGVPDVRTLATIGFLESIQNVWNDQAEDFRAFLGPVSLEAWDDLNSFWNQSGPPSRAAKV